LVDTIVNISAAELKTGSPDAYTDAAMRRRTSAWGQVSDKPRGRKPRPAPQWGSKATALWRIDAARPGDGSGVAWCPLCGEGPSMRTIWADGAGASEHLPA